MTHSNLTKLECAQRQLETAISLYFSKGDVASIHTLTCAAYNVIRDLNKQRGGSDMRVKDKYRKLQEDQSIKPFNEPENFFKHADEDASSTLTFDPTYTECLLVDACEKFLELTKKSIPQFIAFTTWFMCQAPELYNIPEDFQSAVDHMQELRNSDDRGEFYTRFMGLFDQSA